MLSTLNIKNLAVIETSEISFGDGFTVITGETGAGKSILLSALGVILGGRVRADMVRAGADQAEIEALFDLRKLPHIRNRLVEKDLDAGDDLVIRRIITKQGRSRAYINGALVTVRDLGALADGLVDISGQHEHYSLLRPERHQELLDRLGGCTVLAADLADLFRELAKVDQELERNKTSRQDRLERAEFISYQLNELDAADLDDPDEEETLVVEMNRLRHVERLRTVALESESELYGMSGAIIERLDVVHRRLDGVADIDDSLAAFSDELETARVVLEECARGLMAYERGLVGDPVRLNEIESRLALFQRLGRKYGLNLADVIRKRDSLRLELKQLNTSDERNDALMAERDILAQSLSDYAARLSKAREDAVKGLCSAMARELNELGMHGAEIVVDFKAPQAGLETPAGMVGARGAEGIEFLLRANPGEAAKPLQKVASGGELSRIMLAFKRLVAEADPVATYVFDEVDAGVGGAIAEVIGEKLQRVGVDRQAICITHLAQIAAMGNQHLKVMKSLESGRTQSRIEVLTADGRAREVARMLGGRKTTERAIMHAEEMLSAGVAA